MIDWCYHNLAVVSASCYLVEIGAIITLLLFLLAATDFAADINGLTAVVATDYINNCYGFNYVMLLCIWYEIHK